LAAKNGFGRVADYLQTFLQVSSLLHLAFFFTQVSDFISLRPSKKNAAVEVCFLNLIFTLPYIQEWHKPAIY
jgi:hypothetical protein